MSTLRPIISGAISATIAQFIFNASPAEVYLAYMCGIIYGYQMFDEKEAK